MVQLRLETPMFRFLGEVAVKAGSVVHPLAALSVSWDVLRAIVFVRNYVYVETSPS